MPTTGPYCEYENSPGNLATYDRLYNWYAVDDTRALCPAGWRVPSDDDWTTLTDHLGSAAGSQLAGRTDLWNSGSLRDNPAFGTSDFMALPGGYCNNYGVYIYVTYHAHYWSSSKNSATNALHRYLQYNYKVVLRSYLNKRYGFSVRCLRD